MEKFKYETKYGIGDDVFVIEHKPVVENSMYGNKIEHCIIYATKIKGINITSFGTTYVVEKTNEYFKEEDVFLQTETQALYNRFLEFIKKKENKDEHN